MVRYVFNCWRDHGEMLLVRRQFYHDQVTASGGRRLDDDGHDAAETWRRQRAVACVSMWMTRQHCPHMVESTALLTAALLSDDAGNHNAWSTYAARATYAAAFSRFVTGLLDGHQDKQRKQSMYAVAKKIGLPASFVELRHQSTHEQLPSRAKLRSMANKALAWIWNYYWKNLADSAAPRTHSCREAILKYLQGDDARRSRTLKELGRWDAGLVLATIANLQETLPGDQVFLKCLKLSKEVTMARKGGGEACPAVRDNAPGQSQATAGAGEPQQPEPEPQSEPEPGSESELDQGPEPDSGWSLYEGPWKPKPIGVV